jgi:HD-GYP domain-containing protein (c-di-GMP phosphodiesterase class II)
MLVDDESNHLMIKAARGIEEHIWRETKVPIGEGIAGRVAIEGNTRFIHDLKEQGLTAAQEVGLGPTRSMISVPLMIRGEIFGVLNVADKARDRRFLEEDLTLLKALVQKAALTIENQALYESVYTTLTDTLFSLVTTIEAKDPYTRDHSQRVTQWAVQVAEALQVSTEEIDGIRFAGYLHDIGKIGIPDSILMKSTGLTNDEEAIIRTHPIIGERIVKPLGLLPLESSLIRHHHERWDGEGYPDGLRGEEIPLAARILAVADTYDAITSNRTYRESRKAVHALKELESSVGRQFDRRVVLAFRDVVLNRGENLHSAAQEA